MNLAYYYPIIFWNTANLIVDSGSEFISKVEVSIEEDDEEDEEENEEEEEENETADTEEEDEESVKNNGSKYGKIASAIGRMQQIGIKVNPPSVNHSNWTYTPDLETNTIRYGLKGIVKVGDAIIANIIKNRPYSSMKDFLNKVKVNKTQMVNLIKSGAFDEFGNRVQLMNEYLGLISGTKEKVTLQNVNALIQNNILPSSLEFEQRVFNFNKYLKKFKDKENDMFYLDETALDFYRQYFDEDLLLPLPEGMTIKASTWKNIYDKYMANIRTYIVANQQKVVAQLNTALMAEVKEKYAQGTIEKWSMDSVNFYQDRHELAYANLLDWGIENYFDLPEIPVIDRSFPAKDGHMVNMFKLTKIAGTVIDKDKNKSIITLLTNEGVVTVKAYGVMAAYDKQISELGADGKKHVIEKSWFTRGNKIIVNGFRRGSMFIAKKYKSTPGHHFTLITDIDERGELTVQEERYEVQQ